MSFDDNVPRLEAELAHTRTFARLLWRLLRADRQKLIRDELDWEGEQIIDAAFDAALSVWDRHKIYVEQTEPLYDARITTGMMNANSELYLCVHPNGEQRTITREQLLMMGGIADPEIIARRPGDDR